MRRSAVNSAVSIAAFQRRMSERTFVTGGVQACVTEWPHAGNRNRSLSILLP